MVSFCNLQWSVDIILGRLCTLSNKKPAGKESYACSDFSDGLRIRKPTTQVRPLHASINAYDLGAS